MEKNWLIRTQNNQLLGPVSIKKIRELIEKGSLKSEDEISCGNGYWFFIREEDLISKYVNSEIPQGFNPVCEADSVLTVKALENSENAFIPDEDDLEYPDDITQVGSKEKILEELRRETVQDGKQEESEVIDQPQILQLPTQPQKHIAKSKNRTSKRAEIKKSFLNQNLLFIVVGLLFVLALAGFYFRKRLVKEFIEASTHIHILSPAYAQVIPESVKKKLTI
jgi:hypothetical protein